MVLAVPGRGHGLRLLSQTDRKVEGFVRGRGGGEGETWGKGARAELAKGEAGAKRGTEQDEDKTEETW